MTWLEWMEFFSYVVTIVGFPFAIGIFIYEQRKERENEEEELYQRLSDEYSNFLKLLLRNADLQLVGPHCAEVQLSAEQQQRKKVIFSLLISLFERAYILVYEEEMSGQKKRLWASWEDYICEWCVRDDFRGALDELLKGEDEDFQRYILRVAASKGAVPLSQR